MRTGLNPGTLTFLSMALAQTTPLRSAYHGVPLGTGGAFAPL